MAKGKVVELDVREDLKNKIEPFQKIMKAVKSLEKDDTFILHTTFKPKPLLSLLKTKGFTNEVEKIDNNYYVTTFKKKKKRFSFFKKKEEDAQKGQLSDSSHDPSISLGDHYYIDNRGLEPPQPMIRTLSKLEKMSDDETLKIRNDRVPVFLIEELEQLGYKHSHIECQDGSVEITIVKREG
ncbi:DUF2249 domain-containing protein [Desertibacillus haloalkaliphilus]|uniref:DUF2249 domain-containing protein n=1 Tax=Desertibacillus haloalkaliphilus TaxID=1328930 RepID=UPI001C263B3B|nr:DUF2249 domain-containing protein [Desertibacillus haloalkaliphilus]MBU8906112.1 DUF2249 domain-containing protein [Desertibacillus haloalkaliphilus]